MQLADGSFQLIKGQGRLEAHKRLKRSTIRAFVVPESDMSQYDKTVEWLVENRVRESLPPIVKARLAEIDRQRGLSYEEIARRYDMSPATARQYARVAQKASAQVLEMVEKKELGFDRAKTIAEGLEDRQAQEVVAHFVAQDRLDQRETRAAVRIAKEVTRVTTTPLTITELRSNIKKLVRRRGQLGQQVIVTQERLDVLRRLTDELRRDSAFASLLSTIGRALPPEV